MRVLVACEYSGRVRQAFRDRGHDAWSCDLLPAEDASPYHLLGDVRPFLVRNGPMRWRSGVGETEDHYDTYLHAGWDLMIAHPPCTHLAVSGARHFAAKEASGVQAEALEFVRALMGAPIPRICIENPVSIISTRIKKPSQIIQPWMFGHGETKTTCLWLKGLRKLVPTNIVAGRADRIHKMPPHPDRWKDRSRTYQGIADAMAAQWGETPAERLNNGTN